MLERQRFDQLRKVGALLTRFWLHVTLLEGHLLHKY